MPEHISEYDHYRLYMRCRRCMNATFLILRESGIDNVSVCSCCGNHVFVKSLTGWGEGSSDEDLIKRSNDLIRKRNDTEAMKIKGKFYKSAVS